MSTVLKFKKKSGKVDLSKIDNVLDKDPTTFKSLTYKDHSDRLLANKKTNAILDRYVHNKILFDPAKMGVPCYTRLGDHFTNEAVQRLLSMENCERILSKFRMDFVQPIHCVKREGSDKLEDNDDMHTASCLAALARKGLVKGIDKDKWQDWMVPTYLHETNDRTFSGDYALMINGEGKDPWGPFEFLKIHHNNFKYYTSDEDKRKGNYDEDDKQAFDKVTILRNANTIPLPAKHPDLDKLGTTGHIDAIDKIDDLEELNYVVKTNDIWWHMYPRSNGMWGFYKTQYRFLQAPSPGQSPIINHKDKADYDYDIHSILQMVFGDTKLRLHPFEVLLGVVPNALKKLRDMTGGGWTGSAGDISVFAIVEILYKDYYKGKFQVSGLAGKFTWTDKQTGRTVDIVDAICELQDKEGNYIYRDKIYSLKS